ncbi:MAG: hypothetical protein GY822_00035 [Deltaproteobacteria bacterium]|nr:hypothetical protein [Deltaproteobacteria bacterium]
MVAIQDDLDWQFLGIFGFADQELASARYCDGLLPGMRPADWAHYEGVGETPDGHLLGNPDNEKDSALVQSRQNAIAKSKTLKILSEHDFIRRWIGRQGKFNKTKTGFSEVLKQVCEIYLLEAAESHQKSERSDPRPFPVRELAQRLSSNDKVNAVAEVLTGNTSFDLEALLGELMQKEAIPSSTSQLFTKTGIERRRLWEKTWELQRKEDTGEEVGDIPVPPKYGQTDFENKGVAWRLRGKLDVPKERFIAYPSATPPAGAQGKAGLVFGWAGWNHFEQLQAATSLWQAEWDQHGQKVLRKSDRAQREETLGTPASADEALLADAEVRMKLLPILQTMVDLLPWVKQWHNDDGETAPQFEAYVSEECRKVDMSLDEVHLYRLPAKVKTKKAPRAKKAKVTLTAEMVSAQLQALDEGDGANQTAMAKALGVTVAALKKMLTSLEEAGKVRLVKKRPALWSALKDEAAA